MNVSMSNLRIEHDLSYLYGCQNSTTSFFSGSEIEFIISKTISTQHMDSDKTNECNPNYAQQTNYYYIL
ncbi:hypothetical protein DERF_008242 [Dermatophagoides farinae]|uniref:Uncharacterized protein n=1 Tax=Dermatophagoides farinae TaxID=6954 RepID=A0A922I588_DERFA|nr:hypothetical protein DERF_008242 [Dermatophagoides farinae]